MGFLPRFLIAIAFCAASTVAQNDGELILLRHPLAEDRWSRELTCVSENDGAALTWNSNVQKNYKNFEPKQPNATDVRACAVWNSTRCVVHWGRDSDKWEIVNSAVNPMGPVFDYRWEGLREFTVESLDAVEKYQYVGKLKGPSVTAVFSVRAFQEVHVLLCENQKPTRGPCLWIILGGLRGTRSAIRTCWKKGPEIPRYTNTSSCETVAEMPHESQDVVHTYEWRTFTLNWGKKKVQIFKDTNRQKKLLLEAPLTRKQWDDVSHISIRSEISSRVRFHFYDYYLAEKKGAVLCTKEFDHSDNHFCVEMLVGLCPKCKMEVKVVDTKGFQFHIGDIFGNENSTSNDLLAWQLVRLNGTVNPYGRKLKIETKDKRESVWAIGSLRTCRTVGEFRESTITIFRETGESSFWPQVDCQKISYSSSAVINSNSVNESVQEASQIQQLVGEWSKSCDSSCPNFGEVSSFCSPIGCTCAQGLTGTNCDEECPEGYHGYNCTDECGRCYSGSCNAKTGYCSGEGCHGKNLQPPLCKTVLEAPIIQDVTNTTARVFQRMELVAGVKVDPVLKYEDKSQSFSAHNGISEGLVVYELNLTGLEPNRTYTVQTIAHMTFEGHRHSVESLESNFTTTGIMQEILDLKIVPTSESNVTLTWKPLSPENGVIPTYTASIKLQKLLGCEDLNRNTPPENGMSKTVKEATVSFSGLHPYAIYTANVVANTTIPGASKGTTFPTNETSIPTSKVSNLHLIDNNTSLAWDNPEDCTTITGPTNATRLYFEPVVGDIVQNLTISKETGITHFSLARPDLANYTKYRVRVHVLRDRGLPENSTNYQTITWWTTSPGAPPAVTKLEIYEADPDKKTISLRWVPPYPANGEIELYRVSIGEPKSQPYSIEQTIPEAKLLSCAEKRDYVCYRNLSLPPDSIRNDTEILVVAKNKDVGAFGRLHPSLRVWDSYFKVRSQPRNLTVKDKNGTVILTWAHPSISYVQIVRFLISAEFLGGNLQEKNKANFSKKYQVSKYQKTYSTELHLSVSSSYRISVLAMNANNLESSQAQVNISVNDRVAFPNDSRLEVSQNGTLITLIIPGVINAKKNTLVTVTIKGTVKCAEKSKKSSSSTSTKSEWLAAEYKPDKNKPKTVTIGANRNPNVPMNCSLLPEEPYEIIVNTNDSVSRLSTMVPVASSMTAANGGKKSLIWWIMLPIIAVCLVSIALFIRHHKRKSDIGSMLYTDILSKNSLENLTDTCTRKSSTPPPSNLTEDRLSHIYAEPFASDKNTVSLKCFEEYAKKSASNGQLSLQYATFPRGLVKPCEYGRLPQNMPKNRNKNLIAYDETRVVLDKIPGDPYSDYINANYVKGYGEEKAYIATQGPKPNTINDFWRMIWQKKIPAICMVTNLVEGEKTMCEKYWPEVGAEVTHGEITIANIDRVVFADYTFRTFKLTMNKSKESRKVTHLHYTGWPDHGVPMYPQSLVTFLKKLVEILDGHGPVVIHCSEGSGRTGTIILCDMCVRQGIVEREIEVPTITKSMYESRANMLDSQQQYLLAHVIITESIMSTSTQIPCTEVLPTRIKTLRKQMALHVQRLNDTQWQERALHALAGPERKISGRMGSNGSPEQVSATYEMVQNSLYSGFDCDTNYINAVSVDGVRIKEQYLAARLPSASGLPNFWRFIAERNIELVIILQRLDPKDPTFCDVMPGDSILVPVPYIQVETKSSTRDEDLYTIDRLLLTDTSEEQARPQYVTVLTCHGWESGRDGKPPTPRALVSLWKASENILRKDGLTLVLCQNGVTACGLYLALSFLLERMAVERECDVISAVRAVRRSRPEFVQSMEQFDYLYEAVMNYAESFQTYANFT